MHLLSTFAPALTDATLAEYVTLTSGLTGEVKVAATALLDLTKAWYTLPDSTSKPSDHPSGLLLVVELEERYKSILYELIPWPSELQTYAAIFEQISEVGVRDMCHHLLWHAVELNLGREPLTQDKLIGRAASGNG